MTTASAHSRPLRAGFIAGLTTLLMVTAQLLAPSPSFAVGEVSISGTVTGTTANGTVVPLQGVTVSAYGFPNRSGAVGVATYSVQTNVLGSYTFDALPASYKLFFDSRTMAQGSTAYAPEWWNNQPLEGPAGRLSIGGQNQIIDANLAIGGVISGNMKVGNPGSAITQGTVTAYQLGSLTAGAYKTTTVDGNGNYSIAGLPDAGYKLQFTGSNNAAQTGTLWWKYRPSQSLATPIVIKNGNALPGIDVTIPVAAQLSGNVTAAGVQPPNSGTANLYSLSGELLYTGNLNFATNPVSYSFPAVLPGSYKLLIFQPSASEYLSGWADGTETLDTSKTVTVPSNGIVTQDVDLYTKASRVIMGPSPTVSGTATVDNILTGNPGTWSFASWNSTVQLAYNWYRDDVLIPGETGLTYRITNADAGSSIAFGVKGTGSRAIAVEKFSAGFEIDGGVFTGPIPVIQGTPTVGQTLNAVRGTWSPEPTLVSYQWQRNGLDIPGATISTYALSVSDAGTAITVVVTGSREGFAPVEKTSAVTNAGAALTATPVPTIAGIASVGSVLTAVPGAWAPAPVTLSYQWWRGAVAIPGATSASYKLTTADANKALSLSVTGSRSGFTPVTRASAPRAVAGIITAAPTPMIDGKVVVGQVLKVRAGTWAPAPITLSYQWKRNGVAIPKATGAAYKLTALDALKKVTVTVTGSRVGYPSVVKTSATKVVLKPLTKTPAPKFTGTVQVGKTVTAKPGTWAPSGVKLSYQWRRNGVLIPKATKSKYKITKADKGKKITVTVTGKKSGYATVSKTSVSKKAS